MVLLSSTWSLTGALSDNARKHLLNKSDVTYQILKSFMAVNSITLADMDVPESYMEALPKNAKRIAIDKWETLAHRAKSLLLCLRQRFPALCHWT
ncbi:Rop guanine nucleotide exchange factor 7-like protein [Tanacetum coccineum]|uniref:Rop guanine nucleotide exchange factor 7-like protein n=1 Tax=Tanacetum coccineum TaxID=301880 RepID=A0ABQ5AB15_9ASTR